ncbi:MAG: RidA family protein [Dehalococcoidia bacterium]|nr:RidA family protein [Dehalococcoidia bacterium]
MTISARLAELGIVLPAPAAPAGMYQPALAAGPFLFLSGQLPSRDGALPHTGKVGDNVSMDDAKADARIAALNALSAAQAALGTLDRIDRVARLTVYVASAAGFTAQPQVANGASELLRDVFGPERGVGVRTAIGVAELPLGAPVEVELTFLLSA